MENVQIDIMVICIYIVVIGVILITTGAIIKLLRAIEKIDDINDSLIDHANETDKVLFLIQKDISQLKKKQKTDNKQTPKTKRRSNK